VDPHTPVPLRELCPVCFAAGADPLHICFDGNFQLKTMGTSVELRDGLVPRDTRDNRLFVPPNEDFVSLEKTTSKTKTKTKTKSTATSDAKPSDVVTHYCDLN
jgi:hypothetical protein